MIEATIEYKSLGAFEVKDLSMDKRTAVIAHAVYDVIDRAKDISRKGMFRRAWMEAKSMGYERSLAFCINHDKTKQPGLVKDVWEDEKKAFTKTWFGNHTLGNDTLLQMDEGIIRDASFSFKAMRKNMIEVNGDQVRELKEVLHGETSVIIGLPPVNPLAGVVSVNKALDADNILSEFKSYIERMESFCRNTKASDDCILNIQSEVKSARQLLSSFDTAIAGVAPSQVASRDDNDSFRKQLLLLNLQLSA